MTLLQRRNNCATVTVVGKSLTDLVRFYMNFWKAGLIFMRLVGINASQILRKCILVYLKYYTMDEMEYMKDRLDDQIEWYSRKSKINKIWYIRLQVSLLILAALITLSGGVNSFINLSWLSLATAIMGALVAVLSGALKIYKYQENWTEYRTTIESLKHEKFLYLTKCEPYNGSNAFKVLVQRVEALISQENSNWTQFMSEKVNG